MKYAELTRKLKRLGCIYARAGAGSHEIWYNPRARRAVPIPRHQAKEIGPQLLARILRELGIDREEFDQA